MRRVSHRWFISVVTLLTPLVVLGAFLFAAPAVLAQPAASVACDTPSLISAIALAVTNGGTQWLSLAPGCVYTLTAVNNGANVDTNGLPLITNTVKLTLIGNGATIVRAPGAPRFRVLTVSGNAALTLNNVTLSGGYTRDGVSASNGDGGSGGAILNEGGTVTLTLSILRGNATGAGGSCCAAIEAGLGGFGGGIYNDDGVLTVISSTIADNATGAGGSNGNGNGGGGGGLATDNGTVSLLNSTVSGNMTGPGNPSATLGAGGVGGGIFSGSSTLTVTNSTIAANATGNNFSNLVVSLGSGGGIFIDSGSTLVTNSTVANNTVGTNSMAGGYAATSHAIFVNTLFAGNAGGDCSGTPGGSSTHNLAESGNCGTGFTQRTASEINLGPLQDNGGPTLTRALRFPSAAIDAGSDATCPAGDQRGLPRPYGPHCDIGAYEFEIALIRLFLPLAQR